MPALFRVTAAALARARSTFEPSPALRPATGLARAQRTHTAVAPWFDLTPRAPQVDTRVDGNPVGVAATLETFGGVTGPGLPAPPEPGVLVAGNPAAPGSEAQLSLGDLRRQCGLRLCLDAPSPDRAGACLILLRVTGSDSAFVQLYLGAVPLAEHLVTRPTSLAVLVEPEGPLTLDLRARLAGSARASLLIHGAQGFTL